ncbi:MAG: hypothetical protein L0229_30630 [Blastocatellia bacterium]|nr:hypothetical protein [Blastocatellia bacterium]
MSKKYLPVGKRAGRGSCPFGRAAGPQFRRARMRMAASRKAAARMYVCVKSAYYGEGNLIQAALAILTSHSIMIRDGLQKSEIFLRKLPLLAALS